MITRSWHYLVHPGLREAVADFLEQERPAILGYAEEARGLLPYRKSGNEPRLPVAISCC